MITQWGYTVEELDPIIDAETFNEITGNRWADAPGLEQTLNAVSAAVRSFCGWHICPALDCTGNFTADGNILILPTLSLNSISTITNDGETVEDYEIRRNGLVRRKCGWSDKWDSIYCKFNSGFEADALPQLIQVVKQMAINDLAAPGGVRQEQAGGVSISYNANSAGQSGGVEVGPIEAKLLEPFIRKEAV